MSLFSRKTRRADSLKLRTAKPRLELLEDRRVPATFLVNTLADTVDADPALTSLREAITDANNQAGDDIINFSVAGTINLTGALPDLSSNIQIQGPGAASLTVRRDTGGDYRIFKIEGGRSVVLDGLTISNGFATGVGGSHGGGIYNDHGTLTVNNSTVSGNSSGNGGDGGGIANYGMMTVNNSTVSGNSIGGYGGDGGGIANYGMMTVNNSTVSGNSIGYYYLSNISSYGFGGGIYNYEGTLTVSNSTISGNSVLGGAIGYGGGIDNAYGTLTVSNSTISGNSVHGPFKTGGPDHVGGGIANSGTLTVTNSLLSGNSVVVGFEAAGLGGGIYTGGGTVTVSNSTLSGNSAYDGYFHGYGYASGGGIANDYGTVTVSNSTLSGNSASGEGFDSGGITNYGTLTLNNTIVANSTSGGDHWGALSGSHNLIEDGSGGLPDTITGDANLGPLADNGGPTQTHALLAGSSAIDAGDNRLAVDPSTGRRLTTDQRGLPYARISGARVDIGAFESQGQVVIGPDPCDPSRTALFVTGTTDNDTIIINAAQQGVTVKINGTNWGTFQPTGRIIVYGLAGDDDIQVAGGVTIPCWLYGGDGNDRLKGGGGNNVLMGGAGDDLLVGGSNRDILIGGTGADRLVGNDSDDILIAGSTAFDANEAALVAVLQEWTRTNRTYQQRYDNLTIVGVGDGGSIKLSAATVYDDGSQDILTGSLGQDWFFANLVGTGVKDMITDLSANEFATDLDFILSL